MKLGAVFPLGDLPVDPLALRDYAQALEGLGLDYLLTYEHVLGANPQREGGWRGPYTHENVFYDPFVLFSYLAGLTTSLEFATGILILGQRQTALVAKQAACLDVLCKGRFRMGIGVGWNHIEYESLGVDFSQRGKITEEQLAVLHQLWTQPLVTFEGAYHKIDDAGLNPMPVQQPIPVWLGGMAEPVLQRMAKHGAGWMPPSAPVEKLQPQIDRIAELLAENGRSIDDFGMDVRLNAGRQPREEWDAYTAAWRTAGMTHFCVNTMDMGFSSVDEHIKLIEEFVGFAR